MLMPWCVYICSSLFWNHLQNNCWSTYFTVELELANRAAAISIYYLNSVLCCCIETPSAAFNIVRHIHCSIGSTVRTSALCMHLLAIQCVPELPSSCCSLWRRCSAEFQAGSLATSNEKVVPMAARNLQNRESLRRITKTMKTKK